jgi:ergothioneine biosynthesis protein EgtB
LTQIFSSEVDEVSSDFKRVREATKAIFQPLSIEDSVMQSDPFGSPPNWHLAHVTWFFQKILEKYGVEIELKGTKINLDYLNSYYQKFQSILPKSERGRYPRPTVSETMQYRSCIEEIFLKFLNSFQGRDRLNENVKYDIQLGIQHEMQHQELMIYDLQHYFNRFPDANDNYKPKKIQIRQLRSPTNTPMGAVYVPGGIYDLGFSADGFSYDNELPEHKVYLDPFEIDRHPISNGDFVQFIEDGGYENYRYWLADGWDLLNANEWKSPLYWEKRDDKHWFKKDIRGLKRINLTEPVVNISYFEADAYAKWIGKRLPTEAEWEKAACWSDDLNRKTKFPWGDEIPQEDCANLLESNIWGPSPIGSFPKGKSHYGCYGMIGDIWEWTSSEYVLYPNFKPRFPEYTDKWAIGHKVLRGGSFATSKSQIRNSYRNYFKPCERILFAGFRCARDIS